MYVRVGISLAQLQALEAALRAAIAQAISAAAGGVPLPPHDSPIDEPRIAALVAQALRQSGQPD